MINYKEINQRNREIAATNATPEENKLKKRVVGEYLNQNIARDNVLMKGVLKFAEIVSAVDCLN